jgi:hypothetical protein
MKNLSSHSCSHDNVVDVVDDIEDIGYVLVRTKTSLCSDNIMVQQEAEEEEKEEEEATKWQQQ